jgi:hypothetical protein
VDNSKVQKNKSKNLVLTVVNGVAKWVDASEATERFMGLRQERLSRRHFVKRDTTHYSGELE